VGIATTCLTETIGDNVPAMVREFLAEAKLEGGDGALPVLIHASTPSYAATHLEGFHAAVKAAIAQLAGLTARHSGVNILPGLISTADIRHLFHISEDFGLNATLLPDYSRTLDAPAGCQYEILPGGGTPLESIKKMGGAAATLAFGWIPDSQAGARDLYDRCGVPHFDLGLPIGLRQSDFLYQALEEISGRSTPEGHAAMRGRLIDAMVDGHKYLAGKRAVVYGDQDLVIGLASFLAEIGVQPVLCASGDRTPGFGEKIHAVTDGLVREPVSAQSGVDFYYIARLSRELKPDLMVGNSKGYRIARELDAPLVRVGFPIHDRFGGQRLHHLGYRGTQELFDRLVNAVIHNMQEDSSIGYGYI
jgi:nitrogenase molybdenum-iron protein NifN